MSTSTPTPKRKRAVHQPFSWLADDAKGHPVAEFVALTHDVSSGLESCLEIIESSHLDRVDLDPEGTELPAIDVYDAGKILRLAIVTARQLREHAAELLEWIDEHGPGRLQAKSDAHPET